MRRATLPRICHTSGLVLSLAIGAAPALGTEVTFDAGDAPDALATSLRSSVSSFSISTGEDATAQDIVAAARSDYSSIISTLYGAGYYGPTLSIRVDGREASEISPFETPSTVGTISVTVNTGPAFDFGRASVAPLAPGTTLPEGFETGEPAQSTLISEAAQSAVTAWRDAGHAKADLTHQQVTADHRNETLSVDLGITAGPRVTFGALVVASDSDVRTSRIQGIAGFPAGKVYSPSELKKVSTRLRNTGVFKSVSLAEAETVGPNNTLDVAVQLVDQKPRRIGYGVELSTQDGVSFSSFWIHRNLLGGAERLRVDAEVSGISGNSGGIDYSLGARLTRPATFDADTHGHIAALIEHEDETSYVQDLFEVEVGLTRTLSENMVGEVALGLRHSEISDDLGDRSLTHLILPTTFTWDRRDSPANPTRGFYGNLAVTPFLGINTEATSGARAYADIRGYRGIGDGGLVFAGRLQLGALVGDDLDGLPPDLLFFSGGGGTVRGQPYQSLTADYGSGLSGGGRTFIGLSGEARKSVTDAISLVGFYDAGYVGLEDFSDGAWHSGAGLGARYDTSIGPIRLDVAAPVSGDTGDGLQLYIGIGQAF